MGTKLVKLSCRIADIKAVPNTNQQIVSVEFTLGQRKWFRPFRLEYDRPISMEEFKREVVRAGVFPETPEDFLAYVKEEADRPFELEVEAPDIVSNQADKVEP